MVGVVVVGVVMTVVVVFDGERLSVVGITFSVVVEVVVVAVTVGSAVMVGVCTAAGVNELPAFTNTGDIDSIIPLKNPFTFENKLDDVSIVVVAVGILAVAVAMVVGIMGITFSVVVEVVVVAVTVGSVSGSAIMVGVCTAAGVNALSAFTNTGDIDSITGCSSPFNPLDVINGSSTMVSTVVLLLLSLLMVVDKEDDNASEDVTSSSSPTGVSF